jgi:hypothetical protein
LGEQAVMASKLVDLSELTFVSASDSSIGGRESGRVETVHLADIALKHCIFILEVSIQR